MGRHLLRDPRSALETRFSIIEDVLVIDLGRPCRILSSAPRGRWCDTGTIHHQYRVRAIPFETRMATA